MLRSHIWSIVLALVVLGGCSREREAETPPAGRSAQENYDESFVDRSSDRKDARVLNLEEADDDGTILSDGIPVFAPTFCLQPDGSIRFSGGDLRDVVLDFSNTSIKDMLLGRVRTDCLGELWQQGGRDYSVGLHIPQDYPRVYIDSEFVVYPGSATRVERKGAFVTVEMGCLRGSEGAAGVLLNVRGIEARTDQTGRARVELTSVKHRLIGITVEDPESKCSFETALHLPVVGARPGLVFYRGVRIYLNRANSE